MKSRENCGCIVFQLLGLTLWLSGPSVFSPRTVNAATLVRQLSVQKFMATIFCKNWVQILLCAKLIIYTVSILAISDRTVPQSPRYSCHNFLLSFPNLCGQKNSPHCHSRSRNWFCNLPSENKREIEILTVIWGRLLDVLCQIQLKALQGIVVYSWGFLMP
jgi:hypothetical protein